MEPKSFSLSSVERSHDDDEHLVFRERSRHLRQRAHRLRALHNQPGAGKGE